MTADEPQSEPRARTLDLTVVHTGNSFVGMFAPYVPRFVVLIRGSTARLDLALPEDRRHECRFGAVGVSLGAPPSEPSGAGERPMVWRDVSLEELTELIAELDRFREADVDGVPDTGDWFQTTTISGLLDGEPFGLSVSQMQSGFRGADAATFVGLLRRILGVAGLSIDDRRWHGLGIVRG